MRGLLNDLFDKLCGDQGKKWLEELKRFLRREPNPYISGEEISFSESLVIQTQKLLSRKFRKKITVDPVPAWFTPENLARAVKFNLKPIFLPGEEIGENRRIKGWVMPDRDLYRWEKEGKIASDSHCLKHGWYLADFSRGVDYTDGSQVFPDDPLSPIIEKLRQAQKIGKFDKAPIGSRFAIVPQSEWPLVFAEIANDLGLKQEQIRLERAIEFNAIGNIYDSGRGKFNMWEWFADLFEDSDRLYAGHRDHGGWAYVSDIRFGDRNDDFAGRPLVSF